MNLEAAQPPRTDQSNHQAMIATNDSSSINIDEPRWLSANEIRGEGVGEDVSYYYTFLAEPGTLKITADGKNRWGGMSNVIGVVLMDMDANELFKVSVANTMIDKRVVKRVKIHKPQQILMRVLLSEFTLDYQLRIEGAVNLEAAQPLKAKTGKDEAPLVQVSEGSLTISSSAVILPGEAQNKLPQGGENVDHAVALAPGTYVLTHEIRRKQVEVFQLSLKPGETLVVTWRTPPIDNAKADVAIHDIVGAIQIQDRLFHKKSQVKSIQYQARDGGIHYVSIGSKYGNHAGTVYKVSIIKSPLTSRSDTSSSQPHSTKSATTSSPAVLLPGEAQNELPQGGENVDHAVALAPGTYVLTHEIRRKQVEVFQLSLKPGETLVVTWRTPPIDNAKADVAIHDIVGAIQIQDRLFHKKSQVKSIQYQARDGGIHYVSIGSKYGNHAGTVYKISIVP